jgi:predicted nucleic acid-binding protein
MMTGVLVDTSVMLDHLNGDRRAREALSGYSHRSISVVTWLEVMSACPPDLMEETRSFLRTFERLSISEAIADEALRLMQAKPGLTLPRGLTWATAVVNQLVYLTADAAHVTKQDSNTIVAYRRR